MQSHSTTAFPFLACGVEVDVWQRRNDKRLPVVKGD